MIFIAHRANIDGPSEMENTPSAIDKSIEFGYDVEVDLWFYQDKLFLGHDSPQYEISSSYLETYIDKMWIHCKNGGALQYLNNIQDMKFNFFFHDKDKYTLTSLGYIWAYPGQEILDTKCVSVMPESTPNTTKEFLKATAICTDHPKIFETYYNLIGDI
jgi:hypothetical protein